MKVEILTGCISCGACEAINSEVFVINEIAHINEENIIGNEDDCRSAAEACPVSVIKITEED
jgi:ferredoxin